LNLKTERIRIRYSLFAGVIDVQHRLSEVVGKVQSQLGTATKTAVKAEDHITVAFLDVSPGSLNAPLSALSVISPAQTDEGIAGTKFAAGYRPEGKVQLWCTGVQQATLYRRPKHPPDRRRLLLDVGTGLAKRSERHHRARRGAAGATATFSSFLWAQREQPDGTLLPDRRRFLVLVGATLEGLSDIRHLSTNAQKDGYPERTHESPSPGDRKS
jgi:hypothetical protein